MAQRLNPYWGSQGPAPRPGVVGCVHTCVSTLVSVHVWMPVDARVSPLWTRNGCVCGVHRCTCICWARVCVQLCVTTFTRACGVRTYVEHV